MTLPIPKTTLDILNDNCQQEQKLKGGNRLDEQWIRLEELITYFELQAEDSESNTADLEIFQTLSDLFRELSLDSKNEMRKQP